MSSEIQEIKEKLKQMRRENRGICTQNRELSWQISQLQDQIQAMHEKSDRDRRDFENRMRTETKQIEIEIAQRTQQRKDRRREIMTEVRKQADANKALSTQVQSIEAEIERVKQIQEAYPSKFIQQKALARRRRLANPKPHAM